MIYFIHASGTEFLKIGVTGDSVRNRLSSLQTGCPHELCVVATMRICDDAERIIFDFFSGNRVRGEWFRLDPDMEACIASAADIRSILSVPPGSQELVMRLKMYESILEAA